MERLVGRISMGKCSARELVSLKHSLNMLPSIVSDASDLESDFYRMDRSVESEILDRLYHLAELIDLSQEGEVNPAG